ncbi:hypothetical protein [Xenorhabdus mauleonii]|uniref:hypothetical protein n=1 Tax=Xenorhabdus mauleonii TaxID=351675 RepID=UPI0014736D8C|nr:hypothetical protein [Xenorhabdus mauleonii]
MKLEGLDGSGTAELNGYGQFRVKPVLTSTKPHKSVKVYLQWSGQPLQLVGEVSFEKELASFKVGTVDVLPKGPVIADGAQTYTYTATILDNNNNPVKNQEIAHVKWSNDKHVDGLILKAENENNGVFTTTNDGKLKATLTSTAEVKDVMVSLAIENQRPVSAEHPVSFTSTPNTAGYHLEGALKVDPPGPLIANGPKSYTFTATVLDSQKKPARNQEIKNVIWNKDKNVAGLTLNAENENNGVFTTTNDGKLKATLTSTAEVKDVMVSLAIENQPAVSAEHPVSFTSTPNTAGYHLEGALKVDPPGPLIANGPKSYTFTATVLDSQKKPARNQKIKNVIWNKDKNVAGLTLNAENENNGVFTTTEDGKLKATLASTAEVKDVTISLAIENQPAVAAEHPVSFTSEAKNYSIKDNAIDIKPKNTKILTADGKESYTYTVIIIDENKQIAEEQEIANVIWKTNPSITGLELISTGSKTTKKGELTATLTSRVEAKDITVSLAIEDKPAVWIDSKDAVSFKPEKITVNPDKPGPLLVGELYTYTATVKDNDGNPETGSSIDWKLEHNGKPVQDIPGSGMKLEKIPRNDDDKRKGQFRATLTSSKAISNVVAIAIDKNNQGKSPPVEFKWPTIKKPTFTPANGTVIGNGSVPYQFTAEIFEVDGKTPYTGQEVQFEWSLKLPQGNDESKTQLSPPPGSTHKVGSGGTLKASLSSHQQKPAVKGAQVCLQIVNEPATKECSEPVNFVSEEPETIAVTSDQPGPLLVHETYTYTATVKNADGSANDANWGLEKDGNPVQDISGSGMELKKIPRNDDDKKKGQFRATLTSSKAISGLVVTASIGNSKPTPAPAPVEFKWPTIKQPTTGDKSVPGDGGGAYQFKAEIFGADGTTPYIGKKIKFEWSLKLPDPKNPNNDETTLSTPSDPPITEVKDGTLTASLMSYQYPAVQGAAVCLQVAGASSTQQCSNAVGFDEVDLKLQIESVVVIDTVKDGVMSPVTPGEPPVLYGNGKQAYRYQALITRAVNQNVQNGSVPFKNQNLDNISVNWTRDSAISEKDFPQPAPERDETTGKIKTNERGQLYAQLISFVGVKNGVSVTLWLGENTDISNPVSTDKDNDVVFAPEPKQGQLYIYNYNQNRHSSTYGQINKHNRFKDSNHPSNYFPQLSADVLTYESDDVYQNINERPNIVYTIDSSSSPAFIDLGKNGEGPLSFMGKGNALIYAKHTKSDGQTNIYYYNVKTDRMLVYPINFEPKPQSITDGITCENTDSELRSINDKDLLSIKDEFENIFDWRVFDSMKGDNTWKDYDLIKIYDTVTNLFAIYDTRNNKIINNKDKGLLLCTYK